jgi:hypothetical protein
MNDIYLNMLLMGLIGNSELVKKWWTTPNKAFDMHLPKDVPEHMVKNYLEAHTNES